MDIKYVSHFYFFYFNSFDPPKAMALVTDRLNANKPATPEPKPGGKATSAQVNNNKDLEVDLKKDEPSFFGSFFSSAKTQQQKAKKGPQPMEPVFPFSHKSGTVDRLSLCKYSHPRSFAHRLR
jgi:hypothetical protein